jgi:hypothetical protein
MLQQEHIEDCKQHAIEPAQRSCAACAVYCADVVFIRPSSVLSISLSLLQRASRLSSALLMLHPYMASNFGHVRLVVQYLFYRLVQEVWPHTWQHMSEHDVSSEDESAPSCAGGDPALSSSCACIWSLMRYLSTDVDMIRLRARQHVYFSLFNPVTSCTVRGLFASGADEHRYFLAPPILDRVAGVQSAYLSAMVHEYDDVRFGINRVAAAVSESATDAHSADAPVPPSDVAASTPAASSQPQNFQQKVDVSTLTQLAALGDITHEELVDNEEDAPAAEIGTCANMRAHRRMLIRVEMCMI